MALKTIGRNYYLHPEDGEVLNRGFYYFAKYHECKGCGKKVHIYLDEYEAQQFLYYATPRLDRRSIFIKLKDKIPHIKLVVEKGSAKKLSTPYWQTRG